MNDDALSLAVRSMARERSGASIYAGTQDDPEKVAKANRLGREFGIPSALAQATAVELEQRRKQQRLTALAEKHPVVGGFLSDPRNAAIAQDDASSLARISQEFQAFWKPLPRSWGQALRELPNDVARALMAGGLTASRGITDAADSLVQVAKERDPTAPLQRYLMGTTAGDLLSMSLRAFSNQQKRDADAWKPDYRRMGRVGGGLLQGVESVPASLVALGAAAAGAPTVGLGIVGASTYGTSYREGRDAGLSAGGAVSYGAAQGGVEVLTERIPVLRYIEDMKVGSSVFKRITGNMVSEQVGEQAATALQDFNTWATIDANKGKTFGEYLRERPDAAIDTALAVTASVGATNLAIEGGRKGVGILAERALKVSEARRNGEFADRIERLAGASQTRRRDPDAFSALVARLADGTVNENVHIPAERVAQYLQSERDEFSDDDFVWDDYRDQIEEGLATGGDVVIPTGEVAAKMTGTASWEAMKGDLRFSPGGVSLNEADELEAGFDDAIADLDEADRTRDVQDKATYDARQSVFDEVSDALRQAGYTPDAAAKQAELLANRYATRGARLGTDAQTEFRRSNVRIQRMLPPALQRAVAVDGGDAAIKAVLSVMRSTRRTKTGPSLLEWLSSNGGVVDAGGDIAAMGGDRWHLRDTPIKVRDKKGRERTHTTIPGRRKLIRDAALGQGSLIGGETRERTGLDDVLQDAIDAGYFPELRRETNIVGGVDSGTYSEKPDTQVLLDAIRDELHGKPRYTGETENRDRGAADELERLLDEAGLDPQKASFDEVKGALAAFRLEQADGRAFDQAAYHGSPHVFDRFSLEHIGSGEGAQSYGWGLYFAGRKEIAKHYRDTLTFNDAATPRQLAGMVLRETGSRDAAIAKLNQRANQWLSRDPEYRTGDGYDRFMDAIAALRANQEEGAGRLYEVEIPDDDEYLLWDKPLSEQSKKVKAALAKVAMGPFTDEVNQPSDTAEAKVFYFALSLSQTERGRGDDRAASLILHEAGIAGIKYLDGGSRSQGDGSYNYVVFDDSRVSIRTYEQSYGDGPRGRITFDTAGATIELFEARDLSTFIHESAHLFLEELRVDAMLGHAPDQLRDDWQAVADWFAANGHPIADNGTIPVEAHELWARGVERFVMEGKAPSSNLRRAFEAFKAWMLSLYKSVDNLRSPITPEIRDVMQRLIATDEEIAAAQEEQAIKALFTDAAQAGMSEAEFAAYQAATQEARDEAADALLYRVMHPIRAARTKEWKEREASERADVTVEVDALPEFRALSLLATGRLPGTDNDLGRIKLDAAWLHDAYGEDVFNRLPKRVPPIYASARTTDADTIAEMAGFRTGDEMVRTLLGLQERKQALADAGDKRSVRQALIDQETAQRMADRYGDPLNDGSIEAEARAIIHSDRQGEVIASELRALRRTRRERPTPYSLAKQWARDKIADSTVNESTSGTAMQRYQRAARKASQAAEAAMLARDADETFRQKQAQMLNNALIAEAHRAREAVDKAVERLGRLAARKTIKGLDQDHLEQVHALLERFEFRTVSQTALDERESFAAWAARQNAAGFDVVEPARLLEKAGVTNWSRMTVDQLLGLDETVQQIVHMGRFKQKLVDAKAERDYGEVRDEALGQLEQLPPKPPAGLTEPTKWESFKAGVASVDGALLKMETVFDRLDRGNPNGVFNRYVFRPIADAQARSRTMQGDMFAKLGALLKAVPRERVNRWTQRVAVPELFDRETGAPIVLTRDQLVSMALNMGNAGNAEKLAKGHGWNEQTILDVLNRELDASEWAYVQGVWDAINELWPEIAAVEKRVNGVAPEKVEPREVVTAGGTLRGGYFPVVYDPRRNLIAEEQAAKNAGSLFEDIYTRATTRSGATRERTGVKRPIHLSLAIINRHVAEVIHDITHREAVMQADRFLSDRRIAGAVDGTLGPEVRKQFRPWLQHVANEWAQDRAGNAGFEKFLRGARTNATLVGMGFRASTILMQISGLSPSFERVGMRWVAPHLKDIVRPEAWRFVLSRSDEVRARMDNLDRDIKDSIRRAQGKTDFPHAVRRFAFIGIGFMDRVVVVPTWLGAYNKALAGGATEADAGYAADKAVRQSQGAGAAKDLAAVQRGTGKAGEALKLTTMFYSYMSAMYQRQRVLAWDVSDAVRERRVRDFPALLARAWWLLIVPPLLAEFLAGRGPDDDEDEGEWALRNVLMGMAGTIPIARDIIKPLYDKVSGRPSFGYNFTPIERGPELLASVAGDAKRVAEGEETTRATRNALEATGYATGLVPGQLAAATQFLVDVGYGEQDPEGIKEWYEGLTTGKIKEPAE